MLYHTSYYQILTGHCLSFSPQSLVQLAAVFSMQGVGRILCALVLVIVAHTIPDHNIAWRVAVVFGAVPMIGALYFRW